MGGKNNKGRRKNGTIKNRKQGKGTGIEQEDVWSRGLMKEAYISMSIMPMFKQNTFEHIPGIVLCPSVDILTSCCGLEAPTLRAAQHWRTAERLWRDELQELILIVIQDRWIKMASGGHIGCYCHGFACLLQKIEEDLWKKLSYCLKTLCWMIKTYSFIYWHFLSCWSLTKNDIYHCWGRGRGFIHVTWNLQPSPSSSPWIICGLKDVIDDWNKKTISCTCQCSKTLCRKGDISASVWDLKEAETVVDNHSFSSDSVFLQTNLISQSHQQLTETKTETKKVK